MEVIIKVNLADHLKGEEYQALLDESRRRNVPVESVIAAALAGKARDIRDAEQTPPTPPAAPQMAA